MTGTATVAETLQSETKLDVIRTWALMTKGARSYVDNQGFTAVHGMPELVGITGACENVDTLFKVDFFGRRAYLAQSDQLYLELLTPHLKKVYAEIQSFRMEPEADNRHLCQFPLFEIEHQGDLHELMNNVEGIVKSAVAEVLGNASGTMLSEERRNELSQFAITAIPRITYTEAVEVLKSEAFPDLEWGDDLKSDHEAKLTEIYGAMFVTHYPKDIKFFNMRENEDNSDIVNSCDLLLPFSGESAGAAERETNYDTIVERLKTSDMYERLIALGGKDEDFEWYLNAHKNKDIPLHSGAGIGMARVAQFILGVEDIRDAVPFVINSENLV